MNPRVPLPSPKELAILRILWARGTSSVRDVHEAIDPKQRTTYTTTLKLLQIMHEKGIVRRNENARSHLYSAVLREQDAKRRLVADLMHRAFGNSAADLMVGALAARPASADEIAELRRVLDAAVKIEGGDR